MPFFCGGEAGQRAEPAGPGSGPDPGERRESRRWPSSFWRGLLEPHVNRGHEHEPVGLESGGAAVLLCDCGDGAGPDAKIRVLAG